MMCISMILYGPLLCNRSHGSLHFPMYKLTWKPLMYASLVTINKQLRCLIKIESVFHYWVWLILRYNTNTIQSRTPPPHKRVEKVCGWCLQHYPKGPEGQHVKLLKLHWSTYKIHCRTAKWRGGNPFLGYSSQTQRWGDICLSLQETHTHWQILGLQFKSPHFSQKSRGKGPHG